MYNLSKCVYVEEDFAVSRIAFWINLHLYSVECIPVVSYIRQSIADSWYFIEQPCVCTRVMLKKLTSF